MTEIKLKYVDGTEINKTLSWGIHKELSNYLMAEGRLMMMFTDEATTDSVLQICLSSRDNYGTVTKPFEGTNMLDTTSMVNFLTELNDYFENFFFQNQQRIAKIEEKFQNLHNTKQ